MDFMEGKLLSEFVKTNNDQKKLNKIGQALWDFYMHQIHNLKKVHADPHPETFNKQIFKTDSVRFWCMKSIPESFYKPYFELANKSVLNNPTKFSEKLHELEILNNNDIDKKLYFLQICFMIY